MTHTPEDTLSFVDQVRDRLVAHTQATDVNLLLAEETEALEARGVYLDDFSRRSLRHELGGLGELQEYLDDPKV